MPADDKLLEVQGDTPHIYLDRPPADAANLIPSTNCRPPMYRNPYCNRVDTHWYTMDKAILQITENPLNERTFRTHQDGLERAQANS